MASVVELGEQLANLTIAQAVELKNLLKDKYGIEPAAGGAVMMAGPAPAGPADKKVGIIKIVRELTGLGLGEAKAAVEGAPKAIKENVDKKTADDVKAKLEAAGAKVTVKAAG